jgi:quercetin dioxygenase-like cupin family protein
MATAGQTITNNVTGEKLKWLKLGTDTNGNLMQFELCVAPKGHMPVRHIHPTQSESFEVKSGIFKVECGGHYHHLKSGESVLVEPGQPHQWWNESESEEANVIITVQPAKNFEVHMEQIYGIFNKTGRLSFLQIMTMAKKNEMVLAGIPFFIQKIMRAILSPIGKILGYKDYYPEYSS